MTHTGGHSADQAQRQDVAASMPTSPARTSSPKLGDFASIVSALFAEPAADFARPAGDYELPVIPDLPEPVFDPATAPLNRGPDRKPRLNDSGDHLGRETVLDNTPPRLSFLPRDFINSLELSSLSPTTKASSPVSAKSRSSSPRKKACSTPASSPQSTQDVFRLDGRLDAAGGPSTPRTPVAPVHGLTPFSTPFSSVGLTDRPEGAPTSIASLKEALAVAEDFLADIEIHLSHVVHRNYNRVARDSSCTNALDGLSKGPWFCPIPLTPLSRPIHVVPGDYYRSPNPLFATDIVNPVYRATRQAKINLIDARLGLECTKDTVIQASHSAVSPDGIHVFVDMSNIIIGFYNHLKRRRGIPTQKKVPAPAFFFEGLSLILERGRRAEKRVVAGSAVDPHDRSKWPQYMKDAEILGYEMNILSRVSKPHIATSLTQRQGRRRRSDPSASGGSSDEGPRLALQPCLLRNGEQGVDEILHLKMCESVLDYERSTIVLATGDAAAAEFSGGFLAMAERALAKGWHVELVTWKSCISSSWRKLIASGKWQEQFRIVPLDWYLEELFDSGTV